MSAMTREHNLRPFWLSANTFGMISAWCEVGGSGPGCQPGISVCVAQAKGSDDSNEGRIVSGVVQARKTSWDSWVLHWVSKKPELSLDRQGREMTLGSEERFWPMFMENLIGTTFVLFLRKQTVMQDKEEKGEYLANAITKLSDV